MEAIDRIRRHPSPRIRRQLAEAGIDPSSFRLDDLLRIEPLRAGSLDVDRLDYPVAELRLADAPPPVRLGTADRDDATIVLTWTARDLRRIADGGARALARAGVRSQTKVANTLEGGFTTPGSLALGDAVESLGALDVPLGPVRDGKAADLAADLLARIAADVVVTSERSAPALIERLGARYGRALAGVVWLGALPPHDLTGSCRRWIAVPEVSIFAATECASGRLHLDPELHAETCGGELVLTSLAGDSPVLRFATGLAARAIAGSCPCGEPGQVVDLAGPLE